MCQLCSLNTISTSSRWPKALEPLISDLSLLVTTAHTELNCPPKNSAASSAEEKNPSSLSTTTKITITTTAQQKPSLLIPTLRDISTLLEVLEDERAQWWQAKAPERKFWRETCQEEKLTKINVVNNKTVEMIEEFKAKLGIFCRWSLGLVDGVEGLGGGEKDGDVKMEG
ncbi:hypothetical protein M436DRAFT_52817 [Aureobasidium namibiae CBS 147.97]|uniref:Uncharacterized protein n=1 Tax=Aureobasidium namibiae CBS 147.97 TaxID=1043004 RepID=A0A074WCY8_9PEZI